MGQTYVEIAIIVIAILLYFIYLAWEIKKRGLKQTVINLIIKAEAIYNYGDNKEKMQFVIKNLTKAIPMPFNLFITEENIEKFIQVIFDEIKMALDYVPKKGED